MEYAHFYARGIRQKRSGHGRKSGRIQEGIQEPGNPCLYIPGKQCRSEFHILPRVARNINPAAKESWCAGFACDLLQLHCLL